MRFPRRARLVAVGALAVTVAALVAVLRSGGTYEVTAVFDQVNGLVKGAEVRAAGYDHVGSVQAITLGPDGLPRVTLRIDDGYRIRQGASADLRVFSVASAINRYIELQQGSGPVLREGATLGLTRTDQPVEIDAVLGTLDPATRADVRGVLAEMDRATAGRGADVAAALEHSTAAVGETAQLLAEVRGESDSISRLVRAGRRVAGALAADPGTGGAAADELAALLRTTARRQAALGAGLASLPAGLRAPRVALEHTDAAIPRLRGVLRDARPAVRAARPFSRELGRALAPAAPALAQARALATEAPAELSALRPLLRTATPVLEALTPALRKADPMLDQIRVRLPDAFAFFANWADFTANYDANGHAARVGLVFTPAPLNQLGPSDAGAGSLLRPFARAPGVLEGEPWTDYESSFVAEGAGR